MVSITPLEESVTYEHAIIEMASLLSVKIIDNFSKKQGSLQTETVLSLNVYSYLMKNKGRTVNPLIDNLDNIRNPIESSLHILLKQVNKLGKEGVKKNELDEVRVQLKNKLEKATSPVELNDLVDDIYMVLLFDFLILNDGKVGTRSLSLLDAELVKSLGTLSKDENERVSALKDLLIHFTTAGSVKLVEPQVGDLKYCALSQYIYYRDLYDRKENQIDNYKNHLAYVKRAHDTVFKALQESSLFNISDSVLNGIFYLASFLIGSKYDITISLNKLRLSQYLDTLGEKSVLERTMKDEIGKANKEAFSVKLPSNEILFVITKILMPFTRKGVADVMNWLIFVVVIDLFLLIHQILPTISNTVYNSIIYHYTLVSINWVLGYSLLSLSCLLLMIIVTKRKLNRN